MQGKGFCHCEQPMSTYTNPVAFGLGIEENLPYRPDNIHLVVREVDELMKFYEKIKIIIKNQNIAHHTS